MTLDKKHKALLKINILLALLIVVMGLHDKFPQKALRKASAAPTSEEKYDPENNLKYQVRQSLFEVYPKTQYD